MKLTLTINGREDQIEFVAAHLHTGFIDESFEREVPLMAAMHSARSKPAAARAAVRTTSRWLETKKGEHINGREGQIDLVAAKLHTGFIDGFFEREVPLMAAMHSARTKLAAARAAGRTTSLWLETKRGEHINGREGQIDLVAAKLHTGFIDGFFAGGNECAAVQTTSRWLETGRGELLR